VYPAFEARGPGQDTAVAALDEAAMLGRNKSGGELSVGGKLVIGEKGVVNANVQTVDAIVMGVYEGNMIATGNVEIAETGRVTGNIETDSLVISKGGFFNGNVVKSKGEDAAKGPRPVHLVDGVRAVTTQR
jgi:cytoskeletal protein CcmA (bactofilin family)